MGGSVLPAPRGRAWQISIGIIFVVLFTFSASLLGIGVRLRTDASTTKTMQGYAPAKCTLEDSQVVECPSGGFVAVWKRKETGSSVLQDPFSLQSTRLLAESHTNDYPFNQTYPCMCNTNYVDPYPVINCNFVDACMLNVPMVEYMQRVGTPYGYAGDTLIAIGSLLLVCVVLGIVFLVAGNGLCDWCCCCCKATKKEDFYVIDDTKE